MRRSVGSVSTVGTVGSKKIRSIIVQGQRQLFGTVPVPSESSSRFPNEALEDSARDSSAHLKLLSKEAKRESESVIRQAEQGLRDSSGEWCFPFIKANENIDNEAIPDDASRKKTVTPEVVDAKAKSTAETKSKSRAVDAADAEWLIRERHILRGSHFD
jgi:hypothetical protein